MSRSTKRPYTKTKTVDASCRGRGGCPSCASGRSIKHERKTVETVSALALEASSADIDREWSASDFAELCSRCEDALGIACEHHAGAACDTMRCPRCGNLSGVCPWCGGEATETDDGALRTIHPCCPKYRVAWPMGTTFAFWEVARSSA